MQPRGVHVAKQRHDEIVQSPHDRHKKQGIFFRIKVEIMIDLISKTLCNNTGQKYIVVDQDTKGQSRAAERGSHGIAAMRF